MAKFVTAKYFLSVLSVHTFFKFQGIQRRSNAHFSVVLEMFLALCAYLLSTYLKQNIKFFPYCKNNNKNFYVFFASKSG